LLVQVAEVVDELVRLGGRERLEEDRRGGELAPAPPGPPVEELRPCQAEEQGGSVPAEGGDVLDEIQERRLRPVPAVADPHAPAQCRLSKPHTSPRSAAVCSSVFRNAQAISSGVVGSCVSPSTDAIAAAAASSFGLVPSWSSASTSGQ